MSLLNFLGGIGEIFSSWRFYLGVVLSVPTAIWLHERLGNDPWVWFVSVPLVALGLGGGMIWQMRHYLKQNSK